MSLGENTKQRLDALLSSGANLREGNRYGQVFDNDHAYECKGWLAGAQNIVRVVTGGLDNSYTEAVDSICSKERGLCIQESVGDVCAVLRNLLADVEWGLLASIENQTKALVFDDFLDHAKEYAKAKMKNEAGVIAGVVFEDTIRTICRNRGVSESGEKLNTIITALVKDGAFNQLEAKRAKVAAHVRTKATHADWNEFDLNGVKTTIEFTDETIKKHLSDQ